MIELLHMDCMEYMKGCEDNAFDLAIVDPPYGIGNWIQTSGPNKSIREGAVTWNDSTPPGDYFIELSRISTHRIIWA